jgi:hypothetical protein
MYAIYMILMFIYSMYNWAVMVMIVQVMFIQNVDEKGVPAGYEMFTSQVIFPAETDQVTTMLSNLHHSCFKPSYDSLYVRNRKVFCLYRLK